MTAPIAQNVPNVPTDPMFELKGNNIVLTSIGKNFFEQFINYFFTNFSNEGLVAPSQGNTNANTIVHHQNSSSQFTCAYGTLLYNSDTNTLQVCINNGSNVPIFVNVLTSALSGSTNALLLLG